MSVSQQHGIRKVQVTKVFPEPFGP